MACGLYGQVTDPSVRTSELAQRNPIVFASAGFGVMCGCAPHEVMHRNCRFLQSPSFENATLAQPMTASDRDPSHSRPLPVASDDGTAADTTFPQPEAVTHMSAALDACHESLTYLHNFRKDGTPFSNLLFMTPILNRALAVYPPTGAQATSADSRRANRRRRRRTLLDRGAASAW